MIRTIGAHSCSDSLHGWKYLGRESGFGLFAWVLVMLLSLGSAVYMVTINVIDFSQVSQPNETFLSEFFSSLTRIL